MAERARIEERRFFTADEKVFILDKSRGKCASCGVPLSIHSMTTEHIIPLSKGGTNEPKNIIALCYECNQKKTNHVLHPFDYYSYIKEQYMEEICKMYHEYIKEVPWYGRRNYTKEDIKIIEYYVPLFDHMKKQKKGYSKASYVTKKLCLKKVYSEELDDIVKYISNYNDSLGLDSSYIKTAVEEVFKRGCIYKLYRNNEIIAVLPFEIGQYKTNENQKRYCLSLNGIICKYQKMDYFFPIIDSIMYVMDCMSELNHLNATCCDIVIPNNDAFAIRMLSTEGVHAKLYRTEENWNYYVLRYVTSHKEDSNLRDFEVKEALKNAPEKINKIYSDGLERCLGLPNLNEKDKKTKNKKYDNKKKKNKYIPDEYDLEYYLN